MTAVAARLATGAARQPSALLTLRLVVPTREFSSSAWTAGRTSRGHSWAVLAATACTAAGQRKVVTRLQIIRHAVTASKPSQEGDPSSPEEVLTFWFGSERSRLSDPVYLKERQRFWFGGRDDPNSSLRFQGLVRMAGEGELEESDWQSEEGLLAKVILLDQLSREVHRGTALAFRYDEQARRIARKLLADGCQRWDTGKVIFLLTPLMHSELIEDHLELSRLIAADNEHSPRLEGSRSSAAGHLEVLERFGRYPHRNALLGRVSTPAELRWLETEAPGWARSQQPTAASPSPAPAADGIRVLSIDCTGTLFTWSASLGELYRRGAARALPDEDVPPADQVMAAFGPAFKAADARWPLFGYGQVSTREWWGWVVRSTFAACGASWATEGDPRLAAAFDSIYRLFQTSEAYHLYEDARPFLRWALRKGYLIALVSNTTESYPDSILPALGLAEMVHFGVYTKVDGVEKPGAAFDVMLQRASALVTDLKPHQVLHIGDHPRKDIAGAEEKGLRAFLVDRSAGPGGSLEAVRQRLEEGRW